MSAYVPEPFDSAEADVLRRYFTNLDGPVFALVNLPEVVKGALFARYSRSPKSLRRLFLDEFVGDLDIAGDQTVDATVGVRRAEDLYEKVFVEYGDDSVAQLGGVHLACEQASNVLTKILEWGRLMSYLEQSTRYIAYDARLGGRYRFYRDPAVLASRLGTRYVGDMDRLFDAYSHVLAAVTDHVRATVERHPDDSDFVFRQATRAKALDAVRGILPAASLSNVGIYGSGQAFEALLLRLRAHPLPEARDYGELMLHELRKVIPSFLRRVDVAERGVRWSNYLSTTRQRTAELVDSLVGADVPAPAPSVTLVDFDPDAEDKLLAAICYPHSNLPEHQLLERVARLGAAERLALVRAYVGERENRRHKPGRAFERVDYRFDVLSDYGAFRDLQRHRLLTIEWQPLTPRHGYVRPELVDDAGQAGLFDEAMAQIGEPVRRPSRRVPRAGVLRRRDGLPAALRHAVQRPRGDPPDRAALRRAGAPGVPARRPRDAPADRRAGRPSRRRRGDDPPHHRGTRARTARSGAARRRPPVARRVTVVTKPVISVVGTDA